MRTILKISIQLYQHYLSPYKGYRCAYGVHHGGDSCSNKVITIIDTTPITEWLPNIRSQFTDCKIAYQEMQQNISSPHKKKKKKKSNPCLEAMDCCAPSNSIDMDCCSCNPF